jgi:hypothetical protein
VPGTISFTVAAAAVTYGLIRAGEAGWTDGVALAAFAAGMALSRPVMVAPTWADRCGDTEGPIHNGSGGFLDPSHIGYGGVSTWAAPTPREGADGAAIALGGRSGRPMIAVERHAEAEIELLGGRTPDRSQRSRAAARAGCAQSAQVPESGSESWSLERHAADVFPRELWRRQRDALQGFAVCDR